jgi:diacylglycerol kinase (ATP)
LKYVFVFNPQAKRYSRDAEALILAQAAGMFRHATITVAHTAAAANSQGWQYVIDDFVHRSADADCVVAVGGDGTVNIVVSALMQSGLYTHVPLGVIPYGTGNNLVRSFGLDRDSEKALHIIRQGHTIPLDIGRVNQQYYCINTSFGLFPYLVARRVTRSLVGWTYDALRHLGFTPWPLRLCYTDVTGRAVTLPAQRYILGALLNTTYYGSILRMAPDAVCDDGLFDVKLIHETPKLAYPLVFTMILTGQYDLSRYTTTFRARRVEVVPETACHFETDGDVLPLAARYSVEMAGQLRLLVPSWHTSRSSVA